jgi:glucokinase
MKKYLIGIDLGGTNIRGALLEPTGKLLKKLKKPIGDKPLLTLFELLDQLYSEHSKDIFGIGIAAAGLIDRDEGIVLYSPNIPQLTSIRLKDKIQERYDSCVILENDANAAAYGEGVVGSGKDYKDFVILTLGTGIGGGVVINKRLLPIAAEIGHMTIVSNGNLCACGNTGCLEAYASATAIVSKAISMVEKGEDSLLRRLYNGNFYKITSEDIYAAAMEGDSLSRSILKDAGKYLGIGIANIMNIFSPEAIIVLGGLSKAKNIYLDTAISEASKRAIKAISEKIKVLQSQIEDEAGIIGAAMLAFEGCRNPK